jgi:non-specific serine/threonine protein kinase
MVTSRAPLRLSSERRFPVAPLPAPAADSGLDIIAKAAAVQLFVARAQAIDPAFVLDATAAADVAAICRRLDGLPLAIELAATRLSLLPLPALRERLEHALPLLTTGARDAPARQRTLREAIAWSYDLLTLHEQKTLRQLAVFGGGWTLEAAEAVADSGDRGAILETTAALLDDNLLQRERGGGEPRFTMLETIREFAQERLIASGKESAIRQRHADFFVAFAETAAPHLEQATQIDWIPRLEAEHANMRVAVAWLAAHGRSVNVLRIGAALWTFWFDWHPSEGRAWLEAALAADDEAALIRAAALHGAGNLARQTGDPRRGRAHHEEELALRRALGDETGIGKTLLPLGFEAYELDDLARAETLLTESAARLSRSGDTWAYGIALAGLGSVAEVRGDYDRARQHLDASLAIHRARGDQNQIGDTLGSLGWLARAIREYDQAWALFQESLEIDRTLSGGWQIRAGLEALADVAIARGDVLAADDLLAEAATHATNLEREAYLPLVRGQLARVRGDFEQARSAYAAAHDLVSLVQVNRGFLAVDYFSELAAFARVTGRIAYAMHVLGPAIGLRETIGAALSPHDRGEHERTVAAIHETLGADALNDVILRQRGRPREKIIHEGLAAASALLAEDAIPVEPGVRSVTLWLVPASAASASPAVQPPEGDESTRRESAGDAN